MVSFFKFTNNSVFNLHFMKVSMENDNNFGYEKITIVVDIMPLNKQIKKRKKSVDFIIC
jgi:hypothetical protein